MLKLSLQEKQAMRMHVYKMMDASPAYTAAQTEVVAEVVARRSVQSMYVWFNPRFSISLAVLLVAGLSGGTAFAAQSALPGEPLYIVKVNVNEPLTVALATTPAAKAAVNAAIATTRLEEAETLASQGTLDATTTSVLADNFAAHAEAAQAGAVAVASSDPGTAAQLGTTFRSTLAAHGAILAQLASDAGTSSVQANSDALAVQVLTQATHGRADDTGGAVATTLAITPTGEGIAVNSLRADGGGVAVGDVNGDGVDTAPAASGDSGVSVQVATMSVVAPQAVSVSVEASSSSVKASAMLAPVAPSISDANNTKYKSVPGASQPHTSADDGVIALALGTQASTTLTQAKASFTAIAPSLDASTTEQVTTQLSNLQKMFADGNDALMAGDNTHARFAFSRIVRASVTLDAFLKAGKKFNAAFLTSLLK